MNKTKNISIVLTFLALWISNFFDVQTATVGAFTMIFSVGILHGSNDIQIIQKTHFGSSSFLKILVYYVLTVIGAGLVFFVLPQVALVLFISISAYHFGEQHFHTLKFPSLAIKYMFLTSYGFFILILLLSCNAQLAIEIIDQIAGYGLRSQDLIWATLVSFVLLCIGAVLVAQSTGLKFLYKEFFYLLVLYVVFESSSLIWGFATYFVIWHSLPSLLDQVKFLSGAVTKRSIWEYVKSSLVYWISAIVGLVVFAHVFNENDQLFLTLFFTFLAAITFPHVIVMHRLFEH